MYTVPNSYTFKASRPDIIIAAIYTHTLHAPYPLAVFANNATLNRTSVGGRGRLPRQRTNTVKFIWSKYWENR